MGRIVIVGYAPREGAEAELREALREHVPLLRSEGLATDRDAVVFRSADGTYLEVFEWASEDAIDAAHSNRAVQRLWDRFHRACEYRPLANLPECQETFAEFEPVDL